MLSNDNLGMLAAAGTAVCWAFTAIFFSAASRRVGQLNVNLVRLVVACVLLALACAVMGLYRGAPTAQLVLLALSGLVGLTLGDAAGFSGLQILGPRRASLIQALAPGFAALMMVPLLGETLNFVGVAGMLITLGGVAWVVLERAAPGEVQGKLLFGIGMSVLGALGQAGGLILSKAGLGMLEPRGLLNHWAGLGNGDTIELSALYGTLIRMLAGTLLLVAYAVVAGRVGAAVTSLRDRKALAQTGAGAFFGPFVGVSLSLAAVSLTNTAVAATIMAVSPVIVIPIVAIVYKQRVTWRAILGALVAFAGVAVLAYRDEIAAL